MILLYYDKTRHTHRHLKGKQKGKGKFLYSVVSIPQDRWKRFTLYFPDRHVHSDTISACLEASSHMLQLMREGFSYKYPPLSIVRYSFIQLSELEQCRGKKLAQGFNTATQDSNPGSCSWETKALPLSHCAVRGRGSNWCHDFTKENKA